MTNIEFPADISELAKKEAILVPKKSIIILDEYTSISFYNCGTCNSNGNLTDQVSWAKVLATTNVISNAYNQLYMYPVITKIWF